MKNFDELNVLELDTIREIGSIGTGNAATALSSMISTFINALSGLADLTIQVTVPAFAVDMQGAILTVPMAEFGGQSDYIMTIGANFICNRRIVPCRLLLSPDIRSLNFLLKKLGVLDE